MLVGAGYERVYEIGQVYRAEKHATSRHLNEYVSLDLEMGFIEDEHDIMDLQNELLASMFSSVAAKCGKELEVLGLTVPEVPQIPRIALAEALEILEGEYGKIHQEPDLDLKGKDSSASTSWNRQAVSLCMSLTTPGLSGLCIPCLKVRS